MTRLLVVLFSLFFLVGCAGSIPCPPTGCAAPVEWVRVDPPAVTTTIGIVICQPPIPEYPAWGYSKYRPGTWYRPRY